MPFSPTLASIAILLLTNGGMYFGNWLSYPISTKNCISRMSLLHIQLYIGKSKKCCPNTDRIIMRTNQWLTLLPAKIKNEATFLGPQPHSMDCGPASEDALQEVKALFLSISYPQGSDQRKSIFHMRDLH